ncbi:hypothetical protein GQ600_23600 [Phytophthora cactorum]|nr:hypothetical protein GQ600_23600 [Phytophthora cactorum]
MSEPLLPHVGVTHGAPPILIDLEVLNCEWLSHRKLHNFVWRTLIKSDGHAEAASSRNSHAALFGGGDARRRRKHGRTTGGDGDGVCRFDEIGRVSDDALISERAHEDSIQVADSPNKCKLLLYFVLHVSY